MSPAVAAADAEHEPFARVLPGLLFLASIFLLNFISRVIFAPLLPMIEQDLGLSHGDSGSFFLFISSGYCISILASGLVSAHLSHKNTIAVSTVVTGCVLMVLPLCSTLVHLRLALFCLGLGAGLYLPSGLATITAVVAPSYLARGIAIHELAPNIGFVAAPALATVLTLWLSWSASLLLLGLLLVSAGICYGLLSLPRGGRGARPDAAVWCRIAASREFWLMVGLFSMAICSTLGLYAMLPLYLVADRHLDPAEANSLVALSRISAIVMPIAGGWLGDRVGNRLVAPLVLFVAGLLTIPIGLCSGWIMLLFIVLQPMVAVCFFPSGFAVLSRMGPAGAGSAAVSLCIPLAFLLGGGLMPLLVGLIGDHYSLGAGFVCAGAVIGAAGMLALVLIGRQRKTDGTVSAVRIIENQKTFRPT